MTAKRAIELLKKLKEIPLVGVEIHNAIEMAISALKKQTGKKPIQLKTEQDLKIGAGTWKAGTTVYKCPCCDSFISRSSDCCNKCGQALDWSDD